MQATKPVTRHYAVHKGLQKIDATPCNTSNGVALLAALWPLCELAINSFPCIQFVPDNRWASPGGCLHYIKDRRKAVRPFCAASHTFKSINLLHTQIYCQQGLLRAKTLFCVSLRNYGMGIHLFCSSRSPGLVGKC